HADPAPGGVLDRRTGERQLLRTGAQQARSRDPGAGGRRRDRRARRPARPERPQHAVESAAAGRHPDRRPPVPAPVALARQDQPDGVHPPDHRSQHGGCAGDERRPLRLHARPAAGDGRARERARRTGARLPAHRAAVAPRVRRRGPVSASLPAFNYAFAKHQGVVLLGVDAAGARARVGLREDADPAALLEARRSLGVELEVEMLPRTAFDRRLSELYADAALAGGDDFDLPGDLDALAGDIPATADLLDAQDDAPVIRLINGLIAEAARIGASDVHI